MAKTINTDINLERSVGANDGGTISDTISGDNDGGIGSNELSSVEQPISSDGGAIGGTPDNEGFGVNDPLSGIDPRVRKPRAGNNRGTPGNGGRSSGTGKTAQKLDLKTASNKTFATQLVGLHAIAGVLTGQPHICAISAEQAEAMVTAITEVMAQYKIKPNPKVAAWAGLAGVLGMIYVPKVIAFRAVRAHAKRQTVSPIRPQQAQPATDTGGEDTAGPGVMRFG